MKDEEKENVKKFRCIDLRVYELLMDKKKFDEGKTLDTERATSYTVGEGSFCIHTTEKIDDDILTELKKDIKKHCNLKKLELVNKNGCLEVTFE